MNSIIAIPATVTGFRPAIATTAPPTVPPTVPSNPLEPTMPKPEEATYIPTFDETKLGRTQFRRLMDLYAEAKSRAAEAEEAASEYKSQMSALMLKNKVEACRVEGFVARWVKGSTRRTLVPELLLSAGVKTSQLEKGYKVTESAVYFAVFAPKSKPESE